MKALSINPYDPMISLNLAQAYLRRSQTRQSDNRLYQVVTGMAFMNRYRRLVKDEPGTREAEEVEYNFGRAFHGLGIFREAVPVYKRVLASIRKRMDEAESPEETLDKSLARETAYNLVLIYNLTGGVALAQEVSEEWLRY